MLRLCIHSLFFPLGTVLIPGTQQLTAKDILHRLQKSQAKCIITGDVVAPAVDSVGAECQSLKFKLLVSEGHREGWLNFKDLLKWVTTAVKCHSNNERKSQWFVVNRKCWHTPIYFHPFRTAKWKKYQCLWHFWLLQLFWLNIFKNV